MWTSIPQNLFIEGDNLDALKLLQENYLSQIKVIYIDPPYNTGSDLVYLDDFATSSDEYLKSSNIYCSGIVMLLRRHVDIVSPISP